MFLPAVTAIQANNFGAGDITEYGSVIQNGTILAYPNGDIYCTQRPSFETFNPTAAPTAKGRGLQYWETADKLYIVNDDTMYYNDYANTMTLDGGSTAMSSSHRRVYFAELNGEIFITDPANNLGHYVIAAASTVLRSMDAGGAAGGDDFSGFPPNNGSLPLTAGIVVLDKTIYVLTDDGRIWGSGLNDGADWTDSTNVITAEKIEDTSVFIDLHYDNIVVFGTRSIQFFYDARNPRGSPLSTREDVFFNVGCSDPDSVWRNGDDTYFLGVDSEGEIAAYRLRQFQLEKLSSTSLTSYLTSSAATDSLKVTCSGMSAGGVTYYTITTYILSGDDDIIPELTIVFNSSPKVPSELSWVLWEHSDAAIAAFPLVAWTLSTAGRIGEGILACGEIIRLTDDYSPADGNVVTGYIDDYISDYYTTQSVTDNAMEFIVQTDSIGDEEDGWVFCDSLRYVGDSTKSSQIVTVKYEDQGHSGFNDGRTLDISDNRNKICAMGRFNTRAFRFEYTGTEQLRFRGANIKISKGLS